MVNSKGLLDKAAPFVLGFSEDNTHAIPKDSIMFPANPALPLNVSPYIESIFGL